jgi:hypothetical protein
VQQRLDCTGGHGQKLAHFLTAAIFQVKKDHDPVIRFRQLRQQLRDVVFGGRLPGRFGPAFAVPKIIGSPSSSATSEKSSRGTTRRSRSTAVRQVLRAMV